MSALQVFFFYLGVFHFGTLFAKALTWCIDRLEGRYGPFARRESR